MLLDPRFALVIALGVLPALYVWQEGIDRRHYGLYRGTYIPRFYPYAQLPGWSLEFTSEMTSATHNAASSKGLAGCVLTVYDDVQRVAMEYRAAYLTDFLMLLTGLQNQLPERNA